MQDPLSLPAGAGSGTDHVPTLAAEMAPTRPLRPVAGRLHGRALALARLGWWALLLLAVGLILRAIPASFDHLRTPCSGDLCRAQLTPVQVEALTATGLTLNGYAAFSTVV